MRGIRSADCIGRDDVTSKCLEDLSKVLSSKRSGIVIGVFGPMFIGKKTFCRHLVRRIIEKGYDAEYRSVPRGGYPEFCKDITVYAQLSPVTVNRPDIEVWLEALPPKYNYELFMRNCEKARRLGITFQEFSSVMTNMSTCDPLTLKICGEYIDSQSLMSTKAELLLLLRYKERYIISLYEQYSLLGDGSECMRELGDVSGWEELMDIVSLQMDNREIRREVLVGSGIVTEEGYTEAKRTGIFGTRSGGDDYLVFTSSFKLSWMCRRGGPMKETMLAFFKGISENYGARPFPEQHKYSRSLISMLDIFFDRYSMGNDETKDTIFGYYRTLKSAEAFQKSQSYCCRVIQSAFRNYPCDGDHRELLADLAYDGLTMADIDRDVFETNHMFSICNHLMNDDGLVNGGSKGMRSMEGMMARISVENPRFRYRHFRYETTVGDVLRYFDSDLSDMKRLRESCVTHLSALKDGKADSYGDISGYMKPGAPLTEEEREKAAEKILEVLCNKDSTAKEIGEAVRTYRPSLLDLRHSNINVDPTFEAILAKNDCIRECMRRSRSEPYAAMKDLKRLIDDSLKGGNRAFSNSVNRARILLARICLDIGRIEEAHDQMHILKTQISSTADPKLLQRGRLYELYGDYHLKKGNAMRASDRYDRAEESFRGLDCCREMAIIMSKKYTLALFGAHYEDRLRIGDKLRLLCRSEIGKDDAMRGDIVPILRRLLGVD